MSILERPEQKFKVGSVKVEVKNISSEGLCFAAGIRLPVNKELLLEFIIPTKDGKQAKICGYPVWAQETEKSWYEYGVEFDHSPSEKMDLTMELYALCKEMYNVN